MIMTKFSSIILILIICQWFNTNHAVVNTKPPWFIKSHDISEFPLWSSMYLNIGYEDLCVQKGVLIMQSAVANSSCFKIQIDESFYCNNNELSIGQ